MRSLRKFLLGVSIACLSATSPAQQPGGIAAKTNELPDAPGAMASGGQSVDPMLSASISGTVLDINGGIVTDAKVTLSELGRGNVNSRDRVTLSDRGGRFLFSNLPAGRFSFTIVSPGLETFVSAEILLREGERRELPQIALPIASASTEVQVVVTQEELAQEQVREEEKQRVLGVLPNFYTSYIWNAAPLTRRQKFGLAARSITDPTAFLASAVAAGVEQQENTFSGYGQGAQGYGKRFGASYADASIARMIGSGLLPSVLHQDPRYFYKGSGSKASRAWYAIAMAVIAKGDNGRWQPNYSHVGGSLAGGAISNLYHPAGNRGIGLTIDDALIDTAGNAANNLIREFLLRRVTPNVPYYAKGQP